MCLQLHQTPQPQFCDVTVLVLLWEGGAASYFAHEVSSLPHLSVHSWTYWPYHLSQYPQFNTNYGFLEILLSFILAQQKIIDLMSKCSCPPSILENGSSFKVCCRSFSEYLSLQAVQRNGVFFLFFHLLLSQKCVIFRSSEAGSCCIAV